MNYIAVVNTFNRDKMLVERCLNALISQKVKPQRIFLIDQNITGLILPYEIIFNPLIEVTRVNTKSISEARNSIKVPVGTNYIFFCDDDGFPDENYSIVLQNILNKRPELDLIGGVYLNETDKQYYSKRQKMKGGIKGFIDTKKIMGSNLIIRASTFDELKRFSPDFGVGAYWGASEETDLVWKAYFNKNKIDFFHELIIFHPPQLSRSLWGEIEKSFKYGFGKSALVAKWLFKKGKLIVSYEFIEMFSIPALNFTVGLFTLNFKKALTSFAFFSGRIAGLLRGLFYKFV
ncbi:MAG TPA: glycosyltransferase family A protein [Ignavibacteriaceae bacterium]|jgi:hypothetical protein|nr:MAG: Glycosyl transferase family 2 [Ignavibacteria bacterium ADurb.Bin266]OQY74756.1 MAG: hypothetical protein B6D44_03430 [Ignavibacteriales bacterium UTCHB2]HQF41475.1 glycosyltransferase family A protein [Ignavibacteriaceae bacterium]HQI40474.1 glycosyltransferase family A protein [Ignavibacteriaceae bacterium]